MPTFTRANGKTTKLTEMEFILMLMELNIWDNGKMINKKDMVQKFGQMEQNTKEITSKEKNKVKDNFIGQMDLSMMDSLVTIISMAKEYTHGLMVELIKVNGKIIKWMESENSFGLMEENIMEIILRISNTDLVNLNGLMAENTKAAGKMENRMVRVFMSTQVENRRQENGQMEKELDG